MVELMIPGESRTRKLRRDARRMLDLRKQAVAELRAAGRWRGTPRARLLTLTDWYQDRNVCGVCRDHPEHSFSTQVRAATDHRGATAGLITFARLWARRTVSPSL